MTDATMIIGSPEHKDHIRKEVQHWSESAISRISDSGVFSDDQIKALSSALWDMHDAIGKAI